jgi:DNA polymerase III epsilon subunit-like protein
MPRCSTYVVLDFETTSKSPYKCQPIQLAAAAVDSKKLEIIGKFNSYIKPIFDAEKCKELGLDPYNEEETYNITKIKKEQLESAPELKVVWKNFDSFVNSYNYKKSKWDAPVMSGYNIDNYDNKIINRISGEEPYRFGPYDDEYRCCSLFNPIWRLDLLDTVFLYFEGAWQPKSLSFDSLRQYMGMDNSKAHDAEFDVQQTAEMLIRFLKLTRSVAKQTKFENAFGQTKDDKYK